LLKLGALVFKGCVRSFGPAVAARQSRAFGLASLALLFAGCGGSKPVAIHGPAPPEPAARCHTATVAKPLWFRASDGQVLDGALLGSGERGVVVLHGFPGTLCDPLPFAATLAQDGFRVLVYDTRGFGLVTYPSHPNDFASDVQGAVDLLRSRGSRKVFVVGFSFGGSIVGGSTPTLHGVDGVVDVSGPANLEAFFPGATDVNGLARASKLTTPFLYLASWNDPRIIWDETHLMLRAAPVRDKQLYIYPGDYHAFALFDNAPYRARVWRTLLLFLRTR
jgi:alpha-beta hydrolase superfamily lysophospholipase